MSDTGSSSSLGELKNIFQNPSINMLQNKVDMDGNVLQVYMNLYEATVTVVSQAQGFYNNVAKQLVPNSLGYNGSTLVSVIGSVATVFQEASLLQVQHLQDAMKTRYAPQLAITIVELCFAVPLAMYFIYRAVSGIVDEQALRFRVFLEVPRPILLEVIKSKVDADRDSDESDRDSDSDEPDPELIRNRGKSTNALIASSTGRRQLIVNTKTRSILFALAPMAFWMASVAVVVGVTNWAFKGQIQAAQELYGLTIAASSIPRNEFRIAEFLYRQYMNDSGVASFQSDLAAGAEELRTSLDSVLYGNSALNLPSKQLLEKPKIWNLLYGSKPAADYWNT